MTTGMLSRAKQHHGQSGAHSDHGTGSARPVHASRASAPGVVPPYLARKCAASPEEAPLVQRTASATGALAGECGCGTCAACAAKAHVTLSMPSDPLEREADAVADQVMRSPSGAVHVGGSRSAAPVSGSTSGLLPAGGGRALDGSVRQAMEPRFGASFGSVRVHDGSSAATFAEGFSARAYTVGEHVVFGAGEYQPHGDAGRRLIAHELVHVLQQRSRVPASRAAVMRTTKFSGCQGTQPNEIDAAVLRAARALGRAASAVGSAYGRPASVPAARQQLFMDHFHTMSRDHLRDILSTYLSIQRAFEGDLKFQCESTCPTTATSQVCGYAYSHQWFGGSGPIHLCFDTAGCNFSSTGLPAQTALVIHEAAHRHAGIDDKAYLWEAAYSTLSPKQAKDNADSYAWFAVLV